jgi:hypothetical protein
VIKQQSARDLGLSENLDDKGLDEGRVYPAYGGIPNSNPLFI